MAHNINRHAITGKDAFFSVQEKAWHGLGQIVTDYPTSSEAIKFAGLDFEVSKQPLFTYDQLNANPDTAPDGIQIAELEMPNYFATVRKDTHQILGVVGSKYEVVQNKTAFTFFDSLLTGDTGIKYETAGALGMGEKIFITAKMPDVIKVSSKDIIEKYIFLTTTHDGSGSIMAAFTPIRIVCNNTLNMALRNHSNAVFIKHTANAEQKLQEAARIIAITATTSEQLETLFKKWARVRITDAELLKLISLAMAPSKEVFTAIVEGDKIQDFSSQFTNTVNDIFAYSQTSETQLMPTTAGTLFGAYNAITGYYQNVKEYKTADAKLNSIMFGAGLDRTKSAFDICMKANEFLS